MMKCIYSVEEVYNNQTHFRKRWQEGMTQTGAIYPLVPTDSHVIIKQLDDGLFEAYTSVETIAIGTKGDVLQRAFKADERKNIFMEGLGDGKLIEIDRDVGLIEPDFKVFAQVYRLKGVEFITLMYENHKGEINDKPLVFDTEQEANDGIKQFITDEIGNDQEAEQATFTISFLTNRKFDALGDCRECIRYIASTEIEKKIKNATSKYAKKKREEQDTKKENV